MSMNGCIRWGFLLCMLGTMGTGTGNEVPPGTTEDAAAEMKRLQAEYDTYNDEEEPDDMPDGAPPGAREREFCSRGLALAKRVPGTATEFSALLLVVDAAWACLDDPAIEQAYVQAMERLIALYPKFLDDERLMAGWVQSLDDEFPACREALRTIARGGRGAARAEALLTLARDVVDSERAWMGQDPMVGMGVPDPVGRSSRVRPERLTEARGYLETVKRDHPAQSEASDEVLKRVEELAGSAPLPDETDRLPDARSETALRRFASRMAGKAPREAAGILSGCLEDGNPDVRRAAAECLGFLREPSCATALRKTSLEDPDPAVKAEAANALLRLDFEATDQDGKGFKLSDYEGKVVLLAFWGFW